ncbi:MAG: hypothetical protein M3153_06580, partial [Chloroflexota bacterium]|nr:hypothetical protein [Chloroflexota bacterium]
MTRLGLRLATAGGWRGIALTTVGIALGTAVLLLALTIDPAINARAQRMAWRDPQQLIVAATPDEMQTRVAVLDDGFGDALLTRVLVAGAGPGAPVPPGIPALPAAGESYLSPDLVDLVAATPKDELGDRFGTPIGQIGDEALADSRELLAIVGVQPEALPNALGVTTFATPEDLPTPLGFLRIALAIGVVGLLAPVGIFVATATRLSAARRAERIAAVRLVGASPGQARYLAAMEAFVAGGIGGVLGAVGFFAVRPLASMLPFLGHAWYVDDLAPDPRWVLLVVLAVPLVSVAAALFAVREALATPLPTARRAAGGRLSPARLLPLVAAIGLLAATVVLEVANPAALGDLALYAIGAAFLVLVASLVWAGPYLVGLAAGLLGRIARRPATLIAARRLTADARGGFYAISGVVLAVFIGSVFHALIVPITSSVEIASPTGLKPSTVGAVETNLFQVGATTIERIRADLEEIDGVERVVVERGIELFADGAGPLAASVMRCEDADAVFGFTIERCGAADLLTAERFPAGTYEAHALGIEPESSWVGTVRIDGVASFDAPGAVLFPALLDPASVSDGGAGLAPKRILVATDGSPATIERARTAIERHLPAAIVLSGAGEAALGQATISELSWLINFGLAAVMLVAGSTLVISVVAGLIERRRPLGLLRLSGMPLSELRRMVFIEAAGPLIGTALVTALMGIGVAQLIARLGLARDPGLPGASILLPVGIGILGGLVVVLAV